MSRLILLDNISNIQKEKVGKLILLFSQIEWFIANTIIIVETGSENYRKVKDLKIYTNYLHTLLSLNFQKKLDRLGQLGFSIEELKKIQRYRNTITHGLIFESNGILIAQIIPSRQPIHINIEELDKYINLLEIEGGKIENFLRDHGFSAFGSAKD